MSQQPDQSDTSCQIPSKKEMGLLAFFRRNQQRIGIIFTVIIFTLALLTFAHLVEDIDRQGLTIAFSNVSWQSIGIAILAAITSYCMIFGYEWSASRYANAQIPLPTLALGGLSASAIGNALGFSMLTGGSVRYRTYSKKNIPAMTIIQMTVFASLSLGLALPPIAALMAFTDIHYSAKALHLNEIALVFLAGIIIVGYIVFLLIISRFISTNHPSVDSRYLCLGLITIRVPSMRITMLQFLITLLDVLAAGTVLYCLLPVSADIPFGTFLTVYLLALAAGVLSHVPGGLGVFEVVLLAAFQSQLDQPGLLAALFLYRLIYVVMPLIIACLVLLVAEARRFALSRHAARISSTAAPVIALLVFISGMGLIFSSIAPEPIAHLDYLATLLPHSVINCSHLIASLTGIFCLVVAQGLWRRLSSAWTISLILIVTGIIFSLLKGLDWPIVGLLSFTMGNLVTFRKVFYRPSQLLDITYSIPTLVVVGCTVAVSIWLYFFTYRYVPYTSDLWWQFSLNDDASRALRAIAGNIIVLIVIIVTWLLHTSPPKILIPTDEQLALAQKIISSSDQPHGALVFGKDKDILFHPKQDTFIMYACHGRSLVALFDPIGNTRYRSELIWQFRDYCDLHNVHPVFYEIHPQALSDYMDIGLAIIKLGDEAILDLNNFDIEHENRQELNQIWQAGKSHNLTLKIYDRDELPFEKIQALAETSLAKKQEQERGFSIGKLTKDYLHRFRIATIDFKGEIIAFMNLLETNTQNVVSIDIIQILPHAPKLTMEYLLITVAMELKKEGIKQFNLGLNPLSELKPSKGAPIAYRLGSLIFRRSNQFYNIQGLSRFKEKFNPRWEARYMAVPAGLDPLIALTDTATLIAGGLTKLIKYP